MTDLELLASLVKDDAPRATCLAVADRIEARYRDAPTNVILQASHQLARALLGCLGNCEPEALERVREASAYLCLVAANADDDHG